jgi:hypothetical protein
MAFKYRDTNNKVTTRTGMMVSLANKMVSSSSDLRHLPTFEFLPDEEPRVTKVAELDRRYSPVGFTANGKLDKRFAMNR